MNNKTLLVLPATTRKFTRAQLQEFRDNGFIPLVVDEPEKVRQLTSEPPPIDGGRMLILALKAIRAKDDWQCYRHFIDGLIKEVTESTAAGKSEGVSK